MAWAEKMGSGLYRGCYRDPNSPKRPRPTVHVVQADGTGFRRKNDAKTAAEDEAAKARRQAARTKGTLTASILWGDWWTLLAESRTFFDTGTADVEASIVNKHLEPKWGTTPLNEISRSEVQQWVNKDLAVRPGMSAGYVHKVYGLFNLTIRRAVKEEVLLALPCTEIELPKIHKRARPYLSAAHSESLNPHLRQDYADAKDFAMETGLRPGELCGLHEDRLDLKRGWMLVAEVYVERRKLIRPWPKDKDTRMVPLTKKAIEIAKRRLEDRDLYVGCGVPHSDGTVCTSTLVFLTDLKKVMVPGSFRDALRRASVPAKVPRRTPYAQRRGWATRAAEGGLDAFQIAEILGHATLEQAQEYVQQTPAARMKLETALNSYPQLIALQGGKGQESPRGAARGAEVHWKATDDAGSSAAESGS